MRTPGGRGAVLPMVVLFTTSCSGEARDVDHVYLGPDAAPTVWLDSPRVMYEIGDEEGPGMLEQGRAVRVAPLPDGGFLLFTAYFSTGPIQHWRDGQLVNVFGGRGQGPGEYSFIEELTVDPPGNAWVVDGTRMVSFTPEGEPGPTFRTDFAGGQARNNLFLADGSVLINGPGGRPENFGYILHRYDPSDGSRFSYYPLLRDSAFDAGRDRDKWYREMALLPDGKVGDPGS